MISASTELKNILKTENSIKYSLGATIEYNFNSMIDKIVATSNGADHLLSAAFKKLFPIDTIVKPLRPLTPGIKYLIYTTNNTDTPLGSYLPKQSIEKDERPRLYYPGLDTVYKYWVAPKNSNISINVEYFTNIHTPPIPKLLPTNKVVVRFEKNHDTPSSWTIKATKEDGSEITLATGAGSELNDSGEAIAYYNGSSWSKTIPQEWSNQVDRFKKISVQATSSNSGKFIAIIEVSPRWVVDISNDIQSMSIQKETTADSDSIIPVGTLTANSLSIEINKFKQNDIEIKEYSREEQNNNISVNSIDDTKLYLFKNVIINPYVNISSGTNTYKINQGTFYMHSWSISEFGSASVLALDSAKILQESLAPEILVQDAPITSIIRTLLDSIGFSNYNFYVKKTTENDKEIISDNSIPTIAYYWTEKGKTVWECLQELCRDIQMNAFVDENNILNFYSRDYIYSSEREIQWDFSSEPYLENTKTILPNIVNFSLSEVSAANAVKILWFPPTSTEYDGGGSPLWKSQESFLGAGSLAEPIYPNTQYIALNNSTFDQNQNIAALFAFNGYALINDEVIEYDAIEYQYVPKDAVGNTYEKVWIKSQSDIYKYRMLSKAGYSSLSDPKSAYFKPTGKYKIKERGALGTKVAAEHKVSPESYFNKPGESDSNKFTSYSIKVATNAEAKQKVDSGSFTNPSSQNIRRSFLSLSNLDKDPTTFTLATRPFASVNTSSQYFSYGTRMYMDTQFESPAQVGGMLLFSSSDGSVGYYLMIRTTALSKTKKEFRIVKRTSNGKVSILADTQTTRINKLDGIYAGQAYNIDVVIKRGTTQNIITAFINGFKIEGVDTDAETSDGSGEILIPALSATTNVGLICGQGVVYYEYVYAKNVKEEEYESLRSSAKYKYAGVYSDDIISLLYGDIRYTAGETLASREGSLLEFGTTAREIRKTKISYQDKPAIPIKFSTGINQYVTILGSRLQPFSAESYVLNNTSTFIPLDDGNFSSFYVVGNSINKSGQIEYTTHSATEMASKEPVIFESSWIQSEEDAKSLADWISNTVLNKGKYISMEVFGNPLLSPGDIVSINYPLQGLSKETGKYIIVRVENDYSEGISSKISCRAI